MKTNTMREFFKYFTIAFLVMMLVFTPIRFLFHSVANYSPFEPEENLMDSMSFIVGEDSPFFEAFQDKQRVNVLLLGINENLTDTIMVASFDMKAKHVDVISVPRDTFYERPGFNKPAEKKINAAYKGSAVNTAKAVSDILMGMPLHYYAVIKYDGVQNVVDAIGGVPMNIPFDMKYSDPTADPPLYINIPKGEQVLDGEHAMQFLRYRSGYVEGDLGRVKAQQEFVKSAFKQVLKSNLLNTAEVIFDNVESDITLEMATKIATKAIGLSGEDIQTYVIPNWPDPNSPYYVYPKTEEIGEMLKQIYSIEPEVPEGEGDAESEE
ncbi:MAG: LCP family protein [Firmicutes bacterium]|nr:LCP family protein [Bacillota bacterium]